MHFVPLLDFYLFLCMCLCVNAFGFLWGGEVHELVWTCIWKPVANLGCMGVVPQSLSTWIFQTGSFTDLELTKKSRLAAHKPQSCVLFASQDGVCKYTQYTPLFSL